jgi:hypothetical protein
VDGPARSDLKDPEKQQVKSEEETERSRDAEGAVGRDAAGLGRGVTRGAPQKEAGGRSTGGQAGDGRKWGTSRCLAAALNS